ncbi:MAG: hypothetical protein VW685_09830, partial [Ilumatobacter sp.]
IYERFIGYLIIGVAIILIGIVVITSGRDLAKLALVVSGSFLFVFLGLSFYGVANDYGSAGMWIPPFVLVLLLGASAIRALRQSAG